MAFYVTLPPVLLTFYIEFETTQHYWLLVLAATLAPLQGFINTMVYFQRSRRQKVARSLLHCVCGWLAKKGDDEKGGVPAPTKTQENMGETQSVGSNERNESISESPPVAFIACESGAIAKTQNGDDVTINDGADGATEDINDSAISGTNPGIGNDLREGHEVSETLGEERDHHAEDGSDPSKTGDWGGFSISGIEQHWVLNEEWDTRVANAIPWDRLEEILIDDDDYESVAGFSVSRSLSSLRSVFEHKG